MEDVMGARGWRGFWLRMLLVFIIGQKDDVKIVGITVEENRKYCTGKWREAYTSA